MHTLGDKIKTKKITQTSETISVDKSVKDLFEAELNKRAKFKIEIEYINSRRTNTPTPVAVQVWESGKRLDGGGDQSMFWCLDARKEETSGCGRIIMDDNVKNGIGFCTNCSKGILTDLCPIKRIGVFSPKNLAIEIEKLYRDLNFDADIYLKHYIVDTSSMHLKRAKGDKTKISAVYTLERILKDTSSGKTLITCIENFLEA